MTNSPLLVRPATPADKPAVVALSLAVSDHDYIPEAYDTWMSYAAPEGLYVAEHHGEIVGCYCLESHAPGQAYFMAMRIHPRSQGQGIGTEFTRRQVEHAQEAGMREIYLLSALDNHRAHRLVEKNGFINRGPWLVLDEVNLTGPLPTIRRARPARPDDDPAIDQFRRARGGDPLASVLASRREPWAVVTASQSDWDRAGIFLVPGPEGLDGLMLLSSSPSLLLVRWLDGSPQAAAELIALAWQARKEGQRLAISLPLRCEPLLLPLGIEAAETLRAYVFHYTR